MKELDPNQTKRFIARAIKYLGCDTARILAPCGRLFLIIGFNRNTKDDPGQWMKNGEPIDFDYVSEKVIANGKDLKELWKSVKFYRRLEREGWKALGLHFTMEMRRTP